MSSSAPGSNDAHSERHSSLYFAHGDIVLAAPVHTSHGAQSQMQLFRVGQHLLAHHSTVFRDMFTVPQPPDSAQEHEMYDGAPVVRMQDSAEDLASLLKLLYHP